MLGPKGILPLAMHGLHRVLRTRNSGIIRKQDKNEEYFSISVRVSKGAGFIHRNTGSAFPGRRII